MKSNSDPAPADAAPADAGDLFGDPAPADAAPSDPADDLFGAPADGEAPADDLFNSTPDAGDDLFGNPPAEDDLFGQPTSKTEANLDELFEAPAEEPVEEEQAEEDPFADLFKTTRVWKDNTGNFEVSAKLAVIFPDKIRLLKSNGKFCTVPMRRLSDTDKAFVQQVAAQLPGNDVKYIAIIK